MAKKKWMRNTSKKIAKELRGLEEEEGKMMKQRMTGNDRSLNETVKNDEDSLEWEDWLETAGDNQEEQAIHKDESDKKSKMLEACLKLLSHRESEIMQHRRPSEPPLTLEELAVRFKISKERLRQLENRAFSKTQTAMIK